MSGIILQSGMLGSASSYDADAQAWIDAVESADAQALETGVKDAMNQLVIDMKNSSLWTPIKTMNVWMGARTLAGILIDVKNPLSSWTNNNFLIGDYNRTTGLNGDGSTKSINTNRNNNADPQDNQAMWCYIHTTGSSTRYMGGGSTQTGSTNIQISGANDLRFRSQNSTNTLRSGAHGPGLAGVTRDNSSTFDWRGNGTGGTLSRGSQTPYDSDVFVFAVGVSGSPNSWADGRLRAAAIGEAHNLTDAETALATYISSITALSL